MTDKKSFSDLGAADPTTEPFWQACLEGRLIVQRCESCGVHQFYPRPFCLSCESGALEWVDASGTGTIYSLTTVRIPVSEELVPPYLLALVDLDEGPRLLTNIEAAQACIGDRVAVAWRARDGLPPLPVFKPAGR
ncbi:Zn-ribbon domain-containing OB-fold protein [Pseudaminobacter soli (ex Li et al. 2025)]|uniref:Zn-ribbon domain-containing OB-fold protein n=1 Tax=Pseudaminobacter soli (ex Li et al. 2025) TaxID=1295366 RepID=UPI002475F4BF|nr:Zn-ribbon domain-containing OB-fold protein [Mesorhizobium soli]